MSQQLEGAESDMDAQRNVPHHVGGVGSVHQRVQKMQENIEHFFKLASMGDTAQVYRNIGKAGIWCSIPSAEIISAVENLLVEVPIARDCVLSFFGNLVHESTHLYFSRRENTAMAADTSNLTETIKALCERLRTLIGEFNTASLALELLPPLLSLLIELGVQNNGRPTMGGKKVAAAQLYDLLMQCPAVAETTSLLNECFAFLLRVAPEQAIAGLPAGLQSTKTPVAGSSSPSFDNWVWIHIAYDAIGREYGFLSMVQGVHDFQEFALEINKPNLPRQHTLQLQEGYALQFRPICDLLTHFADVKKSITLKVRVRQMVERYFASDSTDYDSEALFLVRLFLMSPSIFLLVMDDVLRHGAKEEKWALVLRVIGLTSSAHAKTLLFGRPLMSTFFSRIVQDMSIQQLLTLINCLSPLTFNEHRGLSRLPPATREEVRITLFDIIGLFPPQQM